MENIVLFVSPMKMNTILIECAERGLTQFKKTHVAVSLSFKFYLAHSESLAHFASLILYSTLLKHSPRTVKSFVCISK